MTSQTLDSVLAISVEAGRRIMEVYASDIAVQKKDDESPLTQADLAAHGHITAELGRLFPDIPVLSEEAADIPFATRSSWNRYWLVDPLDGTKEFIKRNGEFTVNIALVENGEPTLGVVHAPALGVTYLAARGIGAFKIADGQRRAIHTRKAPAVPCLVVSKSHRDAATEAFLANMPPHEAISKGSSLKLCLVAEGSADLYPRLGPTSEWDTGAGHCVAEQAGAQVLRLPDYAPLRYNTKESLLNPNFVIIGDPSYAWLKVLPST
jgi:3'(2'), 5'-bisphosphate nucleotidase